MIEEKYTIEHQYYKDGAIYLLRRLYLTIARDGTHKLNNVGIKIDI